MCIGETIGSNLRGGELIVLESDLGGGKTTLTQGIAKGIGSSEHASSPTFTISQLYSGSQFELHHYDFYRLGSDIGLMQQELEDVLSDSRNIVVVEWPQASIDKIGVDRIVHITLAPVRESEEQRVVKISYPEMLEYCAGEKLIEVRKC